MSTTYSNQPGIHLHENPTGSYLRPSQKQEKLKEQLRQSHQNYSVISNELDHAYRQYTLQKTKQNIEVPEGTLYLFNVIVALEWSPTEAYCSQLQQAFRQASDFLYDVSDGQMAFAHVVFGGPELMDCADIQLMASNRLHPRSWKQGLFSEQVRPIRVGRGLWNSDLNVTIGWDEPEGYRTLIHEWGHYALGLDDEYTGTVEIEYDNSEQKLILPSHSPTKHSFMTSITWSEMLEEKHPTILKTIRSRYQEFEARKLVGPYHLPLPFPQFHFCIDRASPQDDTESWLYLLQKSQHNSVGFDRLLALGTLEHSSIYQALEQLNINLRDDLVQVIKMKSQEHDIMTSVVPLSSNQVQVSIKLNGEPAPELVQLFASDNSSVKTVEMSQRDEKENKLLSKPIDISNLDGHILLKLAGDNIMIYPFCQGGNGCPNHNPVCAPPDPAGSADGNLMLFFGETEQTKDNKGLEVITTRAHAPSGNEHVGPYIYNIASNQPLAKEHNPTLVLFYETTNKGPASGYKHRPILRRLDNESWLPLETYAQYGSPFVAIPLNQKTAPNLMEANPNDHPRIESYQLYWEPMA